MSQKLSLYYTNGNCVDHDWLLANKEMLEGYIKDEMKKNGYIPALDVEMTFTWEYNSDMTLCTYQITSKGLKVGRKKSKSALGYMSKEGIIISEDATEVSLA